jgi:eukaryotic-like serine/threonine-protein kinase
MQMIPSTLDPRQDLAGTPYEPTSHLASGTFGDVFVVRHRELGTELVLKLLKREMSVRADAVDRLKVEARILTRLSHPNLIRVTDFGWTHTGQPYLVSEKLTGETLQERLGRNAAFAPREAVDLGLQLLSGLERVHEARLVHRDVKPANIFLARANGEVVLKLLDFGIAKILDSADGSFGRAAATAEGMVVGTPAYLAPEQVLGMPVDARTDLYATGGVLFRMLTGRMTFVANSPEELVIAQVKTVPERVSKFVTVPAGLDEVVARALAKDPENRYATAAEMAAALRAVTFSFPRTTVPMRSSAPGLSAPVPTPSPPPAVVQEPEGDATWLDPPRALPPVEPSPQLPTPVSRSGGVMVLLFVVAGLLVVVVVLLLFILLRGT